MTKEKVGAAPHDDASQYLESGAAGDVIYQAGDVSADMFIIQDGQIELLRTYAGEVSQVALLGPGDFFGEMAMLEGTPRELTARAVTIFTLLRIDAHTFNSVVRENPEIAIRIIRNLARRLAAHLETDRRAADIAMGPLKGIPSVAPAAPAVVAVPTSADSPVDTRAAGAAVPPAGSVLLVHEPTGREFPLSPGISAVGRIDRTTGRTPEVDLTALDVKRAAGRLHAEIACRDGGCYLHEEPGTQNGTYLNDTRLAPGVEVQVKDGDRVRFGLVELVARIR